MEPIAASIEQYDYHVREWRMVRAQSWLIWQLHNELRKLTEIKVT